MFKVKMSNDMYNLLRGVRGRVVKVVDVKHKLLTAASGYSILHVRKKAFHIGDSTQELVCA
jgi:hypothetical protein